MQGSTLPVVRSQLARDFGCRMKVAHQERARSWLSVEGLRVCLHNTRPWVSTPSPAVGGLLEQPLDRTFFWRCCSQTFRTILILRPLPRASPRPRSATRLSHTQPEAPCVMSVLSSFPHGVLKLMHLSCPPELVLCIQQETNLGVDDGSTKRYSRSRHQQWTSPSISEAS